VGRVIGAPGRLPGGGDADGGDVRPEAHVARHPAGGPEGAGEGRVFSKSFLQEGGTTPVVFIAGGNAENEKIITMIF